MNISVDISYDIVEQLVAKQHNFEPSTCIILELKDEIERVLQEKLMAGLNVSMKTAFSHAWEVLIAESPSY